jgi:hypothetical protein
MCKTLASRSPDHRIIEDKRLCVVIGGARPAEIIEGHQRIRTGALKELLRFTQVACARFFGGVFWRQPSLPFETFHVLMQCGVLGDYKFARGPVLNRLSDIVSPGRKSLKDDGKTFGRSETAEPESGVLLQLAVRPQSRIRISARRLTAAQVARPATREETYLRMLRRT